VLSEKVDAYKDTGNRRWEVKTSKFVGRIGGYIVHHCYRYEVSVTRSGRVNVVLRKAWSAEVALESTIQRSLWQDRQMAQAEQIDTAPRVRCHVPGEYCSKYSEDGVKMCASSRVPEDWNQRCVYQE
jgi:hypothetical protein